MTLREALLTYLQVDSLCITFLVVNPMVPQILIADLVCLVAETFVNLVDLVVHQLLILFVADIVFFPYTAIIM